MNQFPLLDECHQLLLFMIKNQQKQSHPLIFFVTKGVSSQLSNLDTIEPETIDSISNLHDNSLLDQRIVVDTMNENVHEKVPEISKEESMNQKESSNEKEIIPFEEEQSELEMKSQVVENKVDKLIKQEPRTIPNWAINNFVTPDFME